MSDKPMWFRIKSGEHEGRWHLRGWKLSAIRGVPTGPGDDGWLSLAICPLCYALVISDDKHAYGDNTWGHEQWHARTDYPVPADPTEES